MIDNTITRLKEGEVDLGTSIMAVAYDEGVIIGADSRTTMGSYIANRVTDKLTHVTDRIYCCRSGSAADTQAVADAITYHLSLFEVLHGQPEVSTAAHLFSEIVYQNKDRLSAGIIVAGWDKRNGGSVFNVPLGGGLFKQPWAIGGESHYAKILKAPFVEEPNFQPFYRYSHTLSSGSGSTYIYGYCDSTYQPGWNREKTIEFVTNALSLAMRRDGSSGGTIRLADISEHGVERHFIAGDKLPELSATIC
ncbi:Proteasome subunit beta type-1 [Tilletia horrida]|nr:Proteasome subunit beta type-1 [Tilletia horrida]KAK0532387.1 Proteasome subunit beta type-1 [Tilletia horrida]